MGREGNKLEIDLNLPLTLVWAKVGGVIKKWRLVISVNRWKKGREGEGILITRLNRAREIIEK